MARLARAVVPGIPHLVTQRGNRRQPTFFGPDDYRRYRALLAEWCRRCGVEVLAYGLMPNHVHLVAVPEHPEALARALGEAHRRYTREINARQAWTGHLWQGRFSSCALDPPHLLAAARYIERNPVRAGLARSARAWPWSSARAHLAGRDDDLVHVDPLLAGIPDWRAFLREDEDEATMERLRRGERTGRPVGEEAFVLMLEARLGRRLRPHRPGPKPRDTAVADR